MLNVTLITPAQTLFEGQASTLTLPGDEGDFGVLPGHMPLISTLRAGAPLEITTADGTTRRFTTTGGVADVQPAQVTILAETATAD